MQIQAENRFPDENNHKKYLKYCPKLKNRKLSSQEEVQRILPRKSSSQEEEPTKPST